MSVETALSYAALILADADIEVSSEKLLALTEAANVPVEGIWADIFAKALAKQNIKDLLVKFEAGAGGAAPVATGGAAAGGEEAAAEEKEEEAKEESDDDMGFGLFD
ncbi:Rpp1a [Kluyveromyces lactis]|nr:Rpp1a [Kluyveromyces lactis]